jgi:LAS superfamily LD-carboxypeptidase LdcB
MHGDVLGIAPRIAEVPEPIWSLNVKSANLVGQDEDHLCTADDASVVGAVVHRDVVDPLLELRAAAATEGFTVALDSGFRSFERQLSIWNRKASGERAVLDSQARPIDITTLSPRELVFAILRWSALPGASRHHWGTDVDVFDAAAMPDGYQVELIPAEVDRGGMFAPLHEWLDGRIANRTSFGFFRPYDRDRNGVAPERWHLSYAPLALPFLQELSPDVLRGAVQAADMMLKEVVLEHLDEIYSRFVTNINPTIP